MSFLFSPKYKYELWRKIWLSLAKAQKASGLSISDQQIEELTSHLTTIDLDKIATIEKSVRHDVMAHLAAYGEDCPLAKPILHLGATSALITDNADLIQIREALALLKTKLVLLIRQLSDFAREHASLPTLSYTHLQPAQPTTVGKRACLWLQDFLTDLSELILRENGLRFLGLKGATGTQASFLTLFEGNAKKVQDLEERFAKELGFSATYTITGQIYPRKQDMHLLYLLSGLGASAHKFGTDVRLLAHLREMDEPFEDKQIGSSAMPHKRNPMRCERICALSRYLISLSENPAYTVATQWLERTLDDSANRRLVLPEAFLTADAILNLLINVTSRLTIYPKSIAANLESELPFMALETILMRAVKGGRDRQQVHSLLRAHSLSVSQKMKEEGAPSDLMQRIANDAQIGLTPRELEECLDPRGFIGRAAEQVDQFLSSEVEPLLKTLKHLKQPKVELHL